MKQVTVAYDKDQSPVELNLGVGAYRTEVAGLILVVKFKGLFLIQFRVAYEFRSW